MERERVLSWPELNLTGSWPALDPSTLFDARKLWVLCVVIVEALSLQWAPESLALSSVVYACVNGTISLPWAVSKTTQENIVNIEWYFRGQSEEMIAMYAHDHFHPLPSFSGGRAEFLSNAGLTIHEVTAGSRGRYSVDINGLDASGGFVKLSREVTVEIEDHLSTTDGHMHVQEDSVTQYDVTTDQSHLVLKCGHFTHQPSFQVEWQTPSGHVFNSSAFKDGYFRLLVPNPVTGGQYTCRTPANTPCIQTREEATVNVDGCASQNKVLQAENTRFKMNNFPSATSQSLASQRLVFEARLTSDATNSNPLIFSDVLNNEGGAYNPSTGVFTVPKDGMYQVQVVTNFRNDIDPAHDSFSIFIPSMHCTGLIPSYYIGRNITCDNILNSSSGLHVTTIVTDLTVINASVTFFSVYYITPCITDDFLVFRANASLFSNGTIRFTDDMVDTNRFGSYDSESGFFTAPFDGVFFFNVHYSFGRRNNRAGYDVTVDYNGLNGVSSSIPEGSVVDLAVTRQQFHGQQNNLNTSITVFDPYFGSFHATFTVHYISPCLPTVQQVPFSSGSFWHQLWTS